tara:strand:- start:226 stop:489 length:264 start_codon:yes stop_codon:yes gene_type:complete
MLIQNSITAGEILNILDNAKRAVSYDELTYFTNKPLQCIQAGVERLVRDGLAFFEIEDDTLKIKSMPNFSEPMIHDKESLTGKLAFV